MIIMHILSLLRASLVLYFRSSNTGIAENPGVSCVLRMRRMVLFSLQHYQLVVHPTHATCMHGLLFIDTSIVQIVSQPTYQ